jgi:hypothetical protein
VALVSTAAPFEGEEEKRGAQPLASLEHVGIELAGQLDCVAGLSLGKLAAAIQPTGQLAVEAFLKAAEEGAERTSRTHVVQRLAALPLSDSEIRSHPHSLIPVRAPDSTPDAARLPVAGAPRFSGVDRL